MVVGVGLKNDSRGDDRQGICLLEADSGPI